MNQDIELKIHKTIYHNQWDKFLNLIENPVKPLIDWSYINAQGESFLFYCNNLDMAQILIQKGVNIHQKSYDGRSALFTIDNMEVINFYVEQKMPFNFTNHLNKNILFFSKNNLEKSQKMIDLGVDFNQQERNGESLLHFCNHLPTMKMYVSLGLDVNHTDNYDNSVLSSISSFRCLQFLLKKGAKPNTFNSLLQTPLFIPHEPTLQKLKLLIKHGGNPYLVDKNGNGLLHLWVKDIKATQYLMSLGLDSHLKNNQGKTPRDFAQLKQIDTFEQVDIEIEKEKINQSLNQNSIHTFKKRLKI